MPLVLADRVNETTTTTSTGTITLAGAVSGYQSFAVIGNGNTTYYTIVHQTANEWEVGIGTYTSSGTTIARNTVLASSNSGSLVNFSAGTKFVFCDYPAGRAVYLDTATNVTIPGLTLSGGTANGVLYLNGSKVATSGSALTFDGSNALGFGTGGTGSTAAVLTLKGSSATNYGAAITGTRNGSGSWFIGDSGTALGGGATGFIYYNYTSGDPWIWYDGGASTERMRLTSTGLGIGTASPVARLQVKTQTNANAAFQNSTSVAGGVKINCFNDAGSASSPFELDGSTLQFNIASVERMRLNSSGNLGIGTTNPTNTAGFSRQLQIEGATAALTLSGTTGTGKYTLGVPSVNAFGLWDNTASTYRWFVDSSGNLLVGTTSAGNARFVVRGPGTTSATASLEGATSGGATRFLVSDDGLCRWYGTSNAETMRLDNAGNLGIGTASPAQKLTVAGGSVLLDNSYYYYGKNAAGTAVRLLGVNSGNVNYVGSIDSGPTEVNYGAASTITAQYWNISGSEGMRLTSTGLGIGTASPTNYGATYKTLAVNGSSTGIVDVMQNGTVYGQLSTEANVYKVEAVGASTVLRLVTNSATRATLDTSGNLGLGVTPSAWSGVGGVFEIKGNAYIYSATGVLSSGANAFFNGTNWIYKTTQAATRYEQVNGQHQWSYAASGTAGNAISFTQAMTLDSSGNLGIGTTSPTAYGGYTTLAINNATNGGLIDLLTNGTRVLTMYAGSTAVFGTVNTSNLAFHTVATERMRLDTNGNLGIGTASPIYRIDALLGAGSGNIVRFGQSGVSNGYVITTSGSALTHDWANGGSVAMTLNSSGNLGLGVTPSAWFSGYTALQIPAGSFSGFQTATLIIQQNSFFSAATSDNRYVNNGFAGQYTMVSGQHRWLTAPSGTAGSAISFTQAMTLDASGNLGIGTASPGSKVSVNDPGTGLSFSNAASGNFNIGLLAGTGSALAYVYQRANSDLLFGTNNTERARITSGGNFGIGTASPSQRLHVVGGNYRQNDATNSYGFELQNGTGTSRLVTISGGSAFAIQTGGNAKDYLNLDGNGSVTVGDNNLTTTSTNGFLYVPTCAGVPTGTPTAKTGYAPIVVDTTNNRWYFYSGGAWRNAGP